MPSEERGRRRGGGAERTILVKSDSHVPGRIVAFLSHVTGARRVLPLPLRPPVMLLLSLTFTG